MSTNLHIAEILLHRGKDSIAVGGGFRLGGDEMTLVEFDVHNCFPIRYVVPSEGRLKNSLPSNRYTGAASIWANGSQGWRE